MDEIESSFERHLYGVYGIFKQPGCWDVPRFRDATQKGGCLKAGEEVESGTPFVPSYLTSTTA